MRKQYKKGGDIYWYVYAKWQANEPIFQRNPKPRLKGIVKRGKNPKFTCHQHIGRVNSSTGLGTEPQVVKAYQEWENRKRLDAVDKALEEIETALIGVMPEKITKHNYCGAKQETRRSRRRSATQLPVQPNAQFLMPNAQCPMPNSRCPIPDAQCPTPNAQRPMPNAQFPMPNSRCPIPDAQCPMPNDQRPMP